MRRFSALACVLIAAIVLPDSTAAAQVYDAVSDFAGTNGSGAWSYRQRTLSTNAQLPTAITQCGNPLVAGFGTLAAFQVPSIYFNKSSNQVACSTVVLAPNAGYIHPGFNFTDAVLRFTAPTAGSYAIAGGIWSADVSGSNFAIDLEAQGSMFFTASTTAFSPTGTPNTTFSLNRFLNAGDVIDMVARPKSSGDVSFGTTGFRLTMTRSVTTVPEPGALAFLMGGAVALLPFARRGRSGQRS
jgi:hypothetical protein